MPTGTLSGKGKKLFEDVYNAELKGKCKGDKKCAAQRAWGAVKNAGWKKSKDGKWTKKAELAEFALVVKASQDPESGEMRWQMSSSDTGLDSYGDNMSVELYQDFLKRIDAKETVPEQFRSEFWSGGLPYVSVSHYPDLGGKAVPGKATSVYIDGDARKACLKAKGIFTDTPLGKACFEAVKKNDELPEEQKVKVSIAFLDWAHRHKSNSYLFERKSVEDVCPECLSELMDGKGAGKIYLAGQLVHLAMTRVPANKRTGVEVDKSMTTRKEDAESIVGKELAEELDEEAKLVGKSEALVVKAEEEEVEIPDATEEEIEEALSLEPEDEEELVEESEAEVMRVTKKEGGCEHPSSHYLVVEDGSKPTTWHLRVKGCDGKPDHRLMGGAWAALHGGYRGNTYAGPNKSAALSKLKSMYKSAGMDTPSKAEIDLAELTEEVQELKFMLQPKPVELTTFKPHPLDDAISKLKSDYDDAVQVQNMTVDERLQLLQDAFNQLGEVVKSKVSLASLPQTTETEPKTEPTSEVAKAISDALQPVVQEMGLIAAQLKEIQRPPTQVMVPERRSIAPQLTKRAGDVAKKGAYSIREIVERTT